MTSTDTLTNMLLGLAWLGEVDRRQIQRLWFVDKSESTVEKTLTRLAKDGLIDKRPWSIRDPQRGTTVPQLARWSLTSAGHALVKSSDQYPLKPASARQTRLIAHDARTTEAIVRLIEIGRRSRLSGVYVGHELRLNPQERRPICDALLIIQFGMFDRPNLVPWSSDPPIALEGRMRFAIEADNDTEPLAVIAGKAQAYRRLDEDDVWATAWIQRFGTLPIPVWVAPSEARVNAIQNQWKQVWPGGDWLIASDEGLQRNRFLYWSKGIARQIPLGFRPPTSQLPVAPAPVIALPVPAVLPVPVAALPAPAAPVVTVAPAQPASIPAATMPPATAATTPEMPATDSAPPSVLTRPIVARVPSSVVEIPSEAAYRVTLQHGALRQAASRCSLARSGAFLLALLASLLNAASTLHTWYTRLEPTTQRIAWRAIAGLFLASGVVWGYHARPAWLLAAAPGSSAPVVALATPLPALPMPSLVATASPPAAATPLATCAPVRVTGKRVNLRAAPGLDALVIGALRAGQELTVADCGNTTRDDRVWWKVVAADGTTGWTAARWLAAME